ncbi:MAG: DUF6883 domain-containing protein [Chthoniobacteraceae bacterium]
MKLPNARDAIVERRKVIDYLLASEHPEGGGKADFFAHFGFTATEWEVFAHSLIADAQAHPVSSVSESKYGTKYRIDGTILCPDGGSPSIRAVWIIDRGSETPRLVTAHPLP